MFVLLGEIFATLTVMTDSLHTSKTWSSLNTAEQSAYIKKHYVAEVTDLPDDLKEAALHNEQVLINELLLADKTLTPQQQKYIKERNAQRFNPDGTEKQTSTN